MNPSSSDRKIIQITAVSPSANTIATSLGRPKGSIFALCDDGTLWHFEVKDDLQGRFITDNQEWHELPSIPQPVPRPLPTLSPER
jgi:hypothetical protein